jgi:hypothetical protein
MPSERASPVPDTKVIAEQPPGDEHVEVEVDDIAGADELHGGG